MEGMNVGDRVLIIGNSRSIGKKGTIKGFRDEDSIAIEIDDLRNGHDCYGLCSDGSGRFFAKEDLKLIKNEEEEIEIWKE